MKLTHLLIMFMLIVPKMRLPEETTEMVQITEKPECYHVPKQNYKL